MKEFKRSALVAAVLGGGLALSGCGGSGSSSSSNTGEVGGGTDGGTSTTQATTGTFLDSAVEGLRYVTPTKTGLTNANGEFEYEEGEIVFFLLGNSLIGSAFASDVMTPLDMVNEASHEEKLSNVLRFLQSLDEDGNPDNGIKISETVRNQAEISGVEVDFDKSTSEFEAQTSVDNVLSADNKTLVTADTAFAHFKQTLAQASDKTIDLKGTWNTRTTFERDGQKCATTATTTVIFDEEGYTETGNELSSSLTIDGVSCSTNTAENSGSKVLYASAPDDLPAKGCDQGVCDYSELNKVFDNWEAGSWVDAPDPNAQEQEFSVVKVKYDAGTGTIIRTKTDKQRVRDASSGEVYATNVWGTFTTVYTPKEAADYTKSMIGTWDVTFSNLECPDVTATQTLVYSETGIQVSGQELNLNNGVCELESVSGTFAYNDPELPEDFCGPVCSYEDLNKSYFDQSEEVRLSHVRGTDVINRTKGYSHRQIWRKVN
ncbi:hypothetical protein QVZ43_03995 [Marinobacter sp. chi1]|uniref:Adhesin n=1 Tax=Marinobacter suaedae TaxID=3057675 RepID=A0ABT8VXZ7_9GAMM|nr:hypothetical protein [Marinobacter sp. chi1]MDO3720871.1 hypothetical protein [Marinobacter sp. chi1]